MSTSGNGPAATRSPGSSGRARWPRRWPPRPVRRRSGSAWRQWPSGPTERTPTPAGPDHRPAGSGEEDVALQVEQPALAVDAAAVPGQLAVAADDAVAGNDDGDRVLAVGQPDGAAGFGVADPLGQLAVGDGLAVGNVCKCLPYPPLEQRAGRRQRQLEGRAPAVEVLVELA